jgi:hypothetical protein
LLQNSHFAAIFNTWIAKMQPAQIAILLGATTQETKPFWLVYLKKQVC